MMRDQDATMDDGSRRSVSRRTFAVDTALAVALFVWCSTAFSAADEKIAFSSEGSIWTVDVDTGAQEQLTRYGRKLCMGRMKQAAYPWWT